MNYLTKAMLVNVAILLGAVALSCRLLARHWDSRRGVFKNLAGIALAIIALVYLYKKGV